MIRWLKSSLLLINLLCFSLTAQQIDSNNLKIGFVNIRKLMAQAPQVEQIQQKLSSEFTTQNKIIVELRKDIARLNGQYSEQQSDTDVLALQKEISDKERELRKTTQTFLDEYNLRRNEALGKLQTLIVSMVAQVSKEKQLDIVLNNTGVIYVSSRIDITAQVLARLSEQTID